MVEEVGKKEMLKLSYLETPLKIYEVLKESKDLSTSLQYLETVPNLKNSVCGMEK
jgi:hypothetical protein